MWGITLDVKGRRKSSNVEDRRGMSAGRLGGVLATRLMRKNYREGREW